MLKACSSISKTRCRFPRSEEVTILKTVGKGLRSSSAQTNSVGTRTTYPKAKPFSPLNTTYL